MNRAEDWAGLTDTGDGTGAGASDPEPSRAGRTRRTPRASSGSKGGPTAAPRARKRADKSPSALTPDAEAWLATAGPPPDWAKDIVAAHSEPAARDSGRQGNGVSGGPDRTAGPAHEEPFESSSPAPVPTTDEDPGDYLDSGAEEPPRPRRKRSQGGKRRPGREAESGSRPDEEARAIVLRQLTGSAKSRQQLADKLSEREIPEDVAEQVLDRFEELGLVNDREFALMWVRSRAETRRLAASALRRELVQKGIEADIIAEALEQVSEDDERRAARELVDKKLRSQRSTDLEDREQRDKVVRRLVSMLARKGYGGGIAFGVVNDAVREARGH
ncbi:hypothetical protein GCM10008096_17920 [Zhihengliuella salsuginis]|uniref:Regulatory protein RecX n=1 Tax=Zhihengliuella salsuginis TaxID=578222 RepID=A0ABQ3GI59_9MICC|nr:hypothetical protein GCM10008096_17920 [Zhihengliuella salsuginis]